MTDKNQEIYFAKLAQICNCFTSPVWNWYYLIQSVKLVKSVAQFTFPIVSLFFTGHDYWTSGNTAEVQTYYEWFSSVVWRRIWGVTLLEVSLVSRPSHHPVFEHLQYAKMEEEGLVHFITWMTFYLPICFRILQVIRNWTVGRPGIKASLTCLAGMLRFLNPTNFVLRSSTWLVKYYSNFHVLQHIHFLILVELERWLADVAFFPSSTLTAAFQWSRHFQAKLFLRSFFRRVWGPDYVPQSLCTRLLQPLLGRPVGSATTTF